jgi:hypothetical protein
MINIIPFDKRYEFEFLEEKINIKHPVSNYYTKLDDLSVNLYISLKWIRWGYYFMDSFCKKMDLMEDLSYKYIISNSLQNLNEEKEVKKKILIDSFEISSDKEFEKILYENYMNNSLFNSNSKIHMKLKLNLREYLIVTNMLYPTLIKWEKIDNYNKCPII